MKWLDEASFLRAWKEYLNKKRQYSLFAVEESAEEKMPWETEAFFQELDRRVEEVRSGKVKAIPGADVMAKLKKQFA